MYFRLIGGESSCAFNICFKEVFSERPYYNQDIHIFIGVCVRERRSWQCSGLNPALSFFFSSSLLPYSVIVI